MRTWLACTVLALPIYLPAAPADEKITVVVETDDVVRQEAENKKLAAEVQRLDRELKESLAKIDALKIELAYTQDKLHEAEKQARPAPFYKKEDVDRQRSELEARLDNLEAGLTGENKLLRKRLAEAAKISTPFPN